MTGKILTINLNDSLGKNIPTNDGKWIKIMAISDGYVMARRKGSVPFIKSIKEMNSFIRTEQL